jgi:hypothetical protein
MLELLSLIGSNMLNRSPVLSLGRDIMAGNASQGFQDFAKRAYGPQMDMARGVMNRMPSMDNAFGVNQSGIATPEEQGITALLQTNQLPFVQGLPQRGLLTYMNNMG